MDWPALTHDIAAAARQSFGDLLARHGDEAFYAFVLYTDEFTDGSGLITILDHDKAVLFPRATLGNEWYGPVSKLSGIGASGAKRFASSYRDPKDRFVDVESEQNTLVLTTQCAASVLITVA